jgi:hypothetical protein
MAKKKNAEEASPVEVSGLLKNLYKGRSFNEMTQHQSEPSEHGGQRSRVIPFFEFNKADFDKYIKELFELYLKEYLTKNDLVIVKNKENE